MAEPKTVFGSICRNSPHPENDSTEALRYILSKSRPAACAFEEFVRECGCDIPTLSRFNSQDASDAGGTPDLRCIDNQGRTRVLVENKFWAGLTENQPCAYLKFLPEKLESVLLFVVPEARRYSIWQELAFRCKSDGIQLKGLSMTPTLTTAKASKCHRLSVTGWKSLLSRLEEALISADDRATANDVLQLRGLCDVMDAQEFLPLRADELSDLNVPRRIVDYANLTYAIADTAVEQGVCTRKGLRPAALWHGPGVYLWLGKFGMWLGVDVQNWFSHGVSPMWCKFRSDWAEARAGIVRERLRGENGNNLQRAYDDDEKNVVVPILLRCGVEKQAAVKSAVEQLRELRKHLTASTK